MAFLQNLIQNKGPAKTFLPSFPCTICQALALPLAKPGMLRVDITRSVYTFVAVGVEAMAIAHLMNLRWDHLLTIADGAPEAIPIVEVDPEDFNFEGNLNGEL